MDYHESFSAGKRDKDASEEEGEDQKQDSWSSKTKRIEKSSKAGRPSKKSVQLSKSHNIISQQGDNRLSQKSILFYKICDKIMIAQIVFFHKTGVPKGFTWNKDIRTKWNKERKKGKIDREWSPEGLWVRKIEQAKIQKMILEKHKGHFNKEEEQLIEKILLGTSGIHAEEFTEEYYFFMLQLYKLILRQKSQGPTSDEIDPYGQLAESIFNNVGNQSLFFSYHFVDKLPFKEEIKRPINSDPYKQMIETIKNELEKLDLQS